MLSAVQLIRYKEFFAFLLIYIPLVFISVILKIWLTPSYFDGTLAVNHDLLRNFLYLEQEQTRFLQYQIPQLFSSVFHTTIVDSYILQRLLFTFLTFIYFHWFLRRWFTPFESFTGVLIFAAILPFTYLNGFQESTPLFLLMFLLGLWMIREKKYIAFTSIMLLGVFNDERILLLPFVYFFSQLTIRKLGSILMTTLNTFILALPALLVFLVMKYVAAEASFVGEIGGMKEMLYGDLQRLTTHIFGLHYYYYLYMFLLFGFLWIVAFKDLSLKPFFLRRAAYFIPFFLFVHIATGKIDEARFILPLGFILIPLALFSLRRFSSQAIQPKLGQGRED